MDWKDRCVQALASEKLFENANHATRFRELVECFSGYPFFTKGLCKCIYMSAWDEEHFCIMLETLTDLSLGREINTKEMSIKGDALADELQNEDSFIYQFSSALLDDKQFTMDIPDYVRPEKRYFLLRTLKAADVIEDLE